MIDKNRRQFVTAMSAGAAVIPLSALVSSLPARADDLPMVDPASDQAAALQYIAMSDKEGLNCLGCSLYQGDAESKSGPCSLFPGLGVAAEGYCIAYSAKS